MAKIILVVEDDTFLMDAYTLKLSQTDFQVITAANGQEALARIKKNQPDLIILDLLMPVMNGIDFLKQFNKNEYTKVIPILVATNNDQPEIAKEALSLGASDVFIKSDISIKDLVNKCNEYLVN